MKRSLALILVVAIVLFAGCGTPKAGEQPVQNSGTAVHVLDTSATTGLTTPDFDSDGISDAVEDELMMRFAPVVRLHPEEKYLPADISWFVTRVKMCVDVRLRPDQKFLKLGEVTISSLLSQTYKSQTSGLSAEPTDFFLEQTDIKNGDSFDDFRKETRVGNSPSDWICYAHIRYAPSDYQGMYDVQYIFFYAYNGDMAWGPVESAHEADFEHITVRVESDLSSIHEIYYAAHDAEGKWYMKQISQSVNDGYSTTTDGRPIVYSGLDSHASYPWACQWKRTRMPDDYTSENGPEWDCLNRIINVGEKANPNPNTMWIQYSGHWGEIGQFSWTTGPYGPAYQSWWNSDSS
jgi:hypothetical protein